MDEIATTKNASGEALSTKNQLLTTGASLTQAFHPIQHICAHLNAFHGYADDPNRFVETNHYCSHLNEDIRQCLLYDSPAPNARLIGIEYMVTPRIYESLPAEERRLWHSHVYEVKSGMFIMPNRVVPAPAWEAAERAELEQVVTLYGKVYHLWQTDRGDKVPLGEPKLMTSFTADGQLDFEKVVGERDRRFGTSYAEKRRAREGICERAIHPDADQSWKRGTVGGDQKAT